MQPLFYYKNNPGVVFGINVFNLLRSLNYVQVGRN